MQQLQQQQQTKHLFSGRWRCCLRRLVLSLRVGKRRVSAEKEKEGEEKEGKSGDTETTQEGGDKDTGTPPPRKKKEGDNVTF